jgi:4-hydroxybenzoate polyprenyltransferase
VIRQFLLLIRLPNLFTVPTNILVGYFAIIGSTYTNALELSLLILSSLMMYISGIVFNDYFDFEIDLRERPNRPLPSRRVTKKEALIIALISLISANILALVVSSASFIISIILSFIVISYDFKLKNTILGPLTMGSARFLNIILGASPALFVIATSYNLLLRIVSVSLFLFAYIIAISLLSKKEVDVGSLQKTSKTVIVSLSIVFAIILSIVFTYFLGIFKIDLFVNLILFAGSMVAIFRQINFDDSLTIQNGIKYMVISIIVLDSIFLSGTIGLKYGLLSLILIVPSILLARKLYVT